ATPTSRGPASVACAPNTPAGSMPSRVTGPHHPPSGSAIGRHCANPVSTPGQRGSRCALAPELRREAQLVNAGRDPVSLGVVASPAVSLPETAVEAEVSLDRTFVLW